MKHSYLRLLLLGVFVVGSLGLAPQVFASQEGEIAEASGQKLARGVVNSATGWVEIPKAMYEVSKEHNIFAGLLYGPFEGAGPAVIRTGIGGYEAGTFLFPVPADYEPVLEPAYAF